MFFKGATTICASKYFDSEQMIKLYQKGVVHFGENRAQDLLKKQEILHDLPIVWHFIGHLQTNKVKDMINQIDYLHTLDRMSLADSIEKYRLTPLQCFIQVNLTDESQKSGINPDNLAQFLIEIKKYDKIEIIGLMTIGKDHDPEITEKAFQSLNHLATLHGLKEKSMGMSDDYEIALKHGATYIRLGRKFKELLE
jgi:PLP dependent protein